MIRWTIPMRIDRGRRRVKFILLLALLAGVNPVGRASDADPAVPDGAAAQLRIFSTVTAADYILYQLGAEKQLAAIDRHGRMLDEMRDVPVLAATGQFSREALLKANINQAIVWYYQRDLARLLRRQGIPTLIVDPLRPDNYAKLVMELGRLSGRSAAAEKLAARWMAWLEQADARTVGDRTATPVYVELYTAWKSPAQDSYLGRMIARAHGRVVPDGRRTAGVVSPELVLESAPEVIFYMEGFTRADELAARPALRGTPAVRARRIYAIPRRWAAEGVDPEALGGFLKAKIMNSASEKR